MQGLISPTLALILHVPLQTIAYTFIIAIYTTSFMFDFYSIARKPNLALMVI